MCVSVCRGLMGEGRKPVTSSSLCQSPTPPILVGRGEELASPSARGCWRPERPLSAAPVGRAAPVSGQVTGSQPCPVALAPPSPPVFRHHRGQLSAASPRVVSDEHLRWEPLPAVNLSGLGGISGP